MSSIRGEVEVLDPIGLHARPAGQIAKLAKESGLEIEIGRDGEEFVKANSALRLMSLQIKPNEKLVVTVATEDDALGQNLIAQIQVFLKA
jgi:phosphotransferase system HPr (HPr) family protein